LPSFIAFDAHAGSGGGLADVAPVDLVGAVVEVIVAERLEPSKHRVDLGVLGYEGGERILVRPGARLAGPDDHLGLRLALSEPMNASSAGTSQRKIDRTMLFFDLTSGVTYGRRRGLLIVRSVRAE
jgi:hypothetical protein